MFYLGFTYSSRRESLFKELLVFLGMVVILEILDDLGEIRVVGLMEEEPTRPDLDVLL